MSPLLILLDILYVYIYLYSFSLLLFSSSSMSPLTILLLSKDVKRWMADLRGKEMPEAFSWSYKRFVCPLLSSYTVCNSIASSY